MSSFSSVVWDLPARRSLGRFFKLRTASAAASANSSRGNVGSDLGNIAGNNATVSVDAEDWLERVHRRDWPVDGVRDGPMKRDTTKVSLERVGTAMAGQRGAIVHIGCPI